MKNGNPDVYLMTDQPPTCPWCGRRVWLFDDPELKVEGSCRARCDDCHYDFVIEPDKEEA